MSAPRRLVVASRNRGKVEEVGRLLSGLGLEVRSLDEAGVDPALELPEPHETFADNALSKARSLQRLLGGFALGDDSGLEVDALGGAPGVRSARWAGVEGAGRDAANNARLLHALAGVPAARRTARFVCCLALVGPAGELVTARASCEGVILAEARGQGGFGYDPLFLPAGCDRTMAELGLDEKNRLSHRGQALRALFEGLRGKLGP